MRDESTMTNKKQEKETFFKKIYITKAIILLHKFLKSAYHVSSCSSSFPETNLVFLFATR